MATSSGVWGLKVVTGSSLKIAAIAALALFMPGLAAGQDGAPLPKTSAPKAAAPKADAANPPAHPIPYAQIAPKPKAKTQPPKPDAAKAESGKAEAPRPDVPAAPAQLGARLSPGQSIPPGELEAFVDGVVRDAMARDHIAGVTVSVVQYGGVPLKKGYGFASLNPARPVDPDRTLFRIGSITKTFTWIALMKEVEAGRMRLDQPVNIYLPERVQVKDQGFDQPIRIVNLMDHSPGFEDRALGHLFEDDFDRVRSLETYLRQERPKRVRGPGLISSYSNYGAALAGEAASYASGKPYERLIEDEILNPLRMTHTTIREPHPAKAGLPEPMPAALAADVSAPFRWTGSGFQARTYEYIEQIAPAGAASSTAGDMARYMMMQLAGGSLEGATIYGPQAAQAFRTPIRPTAPGVNGWAHGLAIESLPGGFKGYGHDGGTLSFFSDMVVVPQLGLGVFVSTNTEGGGRLASRLAPAIVERFYAKPQIFPRAGDPDLARMAAVYDGDYLSTRRAYSGLEGFLGRLIRSSASVTVTPDGRLVLANPGNRMTFTPEGPIEDGRFIGAQDESRVVAVVKDGQAVGFLPGVGSVFYERAAPWEKPATLGWLALLTVAAAVATLLGLIVRSRRDLRQSVMQGRAGLVQNIQAGLWLLSMILFGVFVAQAMSDIAPVMYGWPNPLIVIASACALVASALTAVTVVILPAVWAGGGRVDSWGFLRKFSFTVTVAIYGGFAVILGLWGALSPWSG